MTTTHRPGRTTGPKLKKLAAGTVLAGGLGMAGMGLTATMASADPVPPPGPTPTITATLHPPAPGGESGLCNRDSIPRGQPLPSNC
ncbi:MAG: hypothetical protein QOE30_4427 [Mycobacterium sp.]|jgi:hypothetical protein|nr:hypothetical protein [Mycobacterium sp.]